MVSSLALEALSSIFPFCRMKTKHESNHAILNCTSFYTGKLRLFQTFLNACYSVLIFPAVSVAFLFKQYWNINIVYCTFIAPNVCKATSYLPFLALRLAGFPFAWLERTGVFRELLIVVFRALRFQRALVLTVHLFRRKLYTRQSMWMGQGSL